MKKIYLFALCLAVVAGVGSQWYAGSHSDALPALERQRSSYTPEEVAANGVVEGLRPETKVRPQIAGVLAAVHVREGQQVAAGTLLAELRNETQKHRVLLTKAELSKANAALTRLRNGERREKKQAAAAHELAKKTHFQNTEADFRRLEKLRYTRAASQQEWDAAFFACQRSKAEWQEAKAELALIEAPARTEDVAAAEAEVAVADANHRLAQEELAKTRLVAVRSGCVTQVYAEPGEVASPDSQQPLLIMADLSQRRVRAFIEELDASRVKTGHAAVITLDGLPGREFHGTVSVIVPRMGKRTPHSDAPGEYKDVHYREVLVDLDGGDELPLNIRVQTRIRTGAPDLFGQESKAGQVAHSTNTRPE